MGNWCCGHRSSPSQAPTPTTTSTALTGISTATTSQTISSSRISNCSGQSGISAASSGDDSFPNGKVLSTHNLRRFTFQELRTATKNFKIDNMLGEGGFGKVYKGTVEDKHNQHLIQNQNQQLLQQQNSSSSYSSSSYSKSGGGMLVAVKKLNSESMQGLKEWQTEIDFLGRLSHPNLVKLLGYCWEDEELLLIYEYMQRGSLENHLFGRGSAVKPLPWELRLKIAIGSARGFAFLHASDDRVIYRDIKAANILLDGVYNAKISDFGLAKLGPSASQSHVTTQVMGTFGYAAPEYMATGHLYIKSDVYSFGVVMTELLTGLRAQDPTRPSGRNTLTDWIKPHLANKRRLKPMMDVRLQGRYPFKAAFEMAQLALKCLEHEPKFRPSMKEVVEKLEQIQAMGETGGNNVRESGRKTTRQQNNNGMVRVNGGLRDQRGGVLQQGVRAR